MMKAAKSNGNGGHKETTPVKTTDTNNDSSQVTCKLTVNMYPDSREEKWNNRSLSKVDEIEASPRSEESLKIVTTSPLVIMLNGKQYDFGNAIVNQVLDESGHVIMKFNGNVMTEYGQNSKKVYEGGFAGDVKTGFMRNGTGMEYDGREVLKRICTYENGKVKRVVQEFSGDIMTEYNENGKKIYEGGYKEVAETGFIRNGNGKEMDENGNVVKRGVWVNGRSESTIAKSMNSLNTRPGEIEELRIDSNSQRDTTCLLLSAECSSLKRIEIGDDCFTRVTKVSIDGLKELETIVIGKSCFTHAKSRKDVIKISTTNGDFQITNCPKLVSISIGNYSFSGYDSLVLDNLPSLQTIDISGYCFYRAPKFSLTGCISSSLSL